MRKCKNTYFRIFWKGGGGVGGYKNVYVVSIVDKIWMSIVQQYLIKHFTVQLQNVSYYFCILISQFLTFPHTLCYNDNKHIVLFLPLSAWVHLNNDNTHIVLFLPLSAWVHLDSDNTHIVLFWYLSVWVHLDNDR